MSHLLQRLNVWLLVGLLCLGAGQASAETVAASNVTEWQGSCGSCWFGSAAAACNDMAAYQQAANPANTVSGTMEGSTCRLTFTRVSDGFLQYSNSYPATRSVLSCPGAGWTLYGSSCTRSDCVGNQTRNGAGSCVYPTCPSSGAASPYSGQTMSVDASVWNSSTACDQGTGCLMKTGGGIAAGGYYAMTIGGYTGGACAVQAGATTQSLNSDGSSAPVGAAPSAPSSPSTDQNACYALGKCPITINAVTTCGTCAQYKDVVDTVVTSSDNSTVKKSTSTSVNCASGNCVSTEQTTTTTTPASGSPTTTVQSKTTDAGASQFCRENPTSAACVAVTDICAKFPERVGCKEMGTPETVADLTTKAIGVASLSAVTLPGGAGSCPSDVNLPRGASFSWWPVCQFASGLKPIILAMAWLTAGLIVLGAGARV